VLELRARYAEVFAPVADNLIIAHIDQPRSGCPRRSILPPMPKNPAERRRVCAALSVNGQVVSGKSSQHAKP
jgi:hypothetical protein